MLWITLLPCLFLSVVSYAQVKGLMVEKYYIADQNDLTDTTGGRSLPPNAVTYRVFVEIEPGSRIVGLFGSQYHPLVLRSTDLFYNNNDRPSSNFGYKLKTSWFEDNPTLALDSWLTLAYAADTRKGVLKANDPDGDILSGTNNTGGTAMISSGLLLNNNSAMGVPLSTSDGLTTSPLVNGIVPAGFTDFSGNDTTVFGPDSIGSVFECYSCAIQNNSGVIGPAVDSNRVLVAQLTTAGDLELKLNISVLESDGNGGMHIVNYVSGDDTLLTDEVVSPFLTYPVACGCTDAHYLEFSAVYSCNQQDSCKTLIRFGCMDTSACNYDPDANFNIQTMCCYPGYCNDRDIALVCPELNNGRNADNGFVLYPNPGDGSFTMEIRATDIGETVQMTVYDVAGNAVMKDSILLGEAVTVSKRKFTGLEPGIYIVTVTGLKDTSVVKYVVNQ